MFVIGQNTNRILGLDILRSVSILYVVYFHGNNIICKYVADVHYFSPVLFDGVSAFFVLSGFLVGGIVIRSIESNRFNSFSDIRFFWLRRWFRTLPNYYFIVLLLFFLHILFNTYWVEDFSWKYLVFLQNFKEPHPHFFPEAWSLCIEEWFYISFPIIYMLLSKAVLKNSKKSLIATILIFLIVPLVLRLSYYTKVFDANYVDAHFRKVTLFRFDSIMYGVIGAFIQYYHPKLWTCKKNTLILIGMGVLILNKLFPLMLNIPEMLLFNFEALSILLCLPFLSNYKSCSFKPAAAVFTYISIISYSMYLLNLTPVSKLILPLIKAPFHIQGDSTEFSSLVLYALFWILTFILSRFFYVFFERPMTGLREKFNQ